MDGVSDPAAVLGVGVVALVPWLRRGRPPDGGNVSELTVVILPCHKAARGRGAKLPTGLRVGDAERVRHAGDRVRARAERVEQLKTRHTGSLLLPRSRNPRLAGFPAQKVQFCGGSLMRAGQQRETPVAINQPASLSSRWNSLTEHRAGSVRAKVASCSQQTRACSNRASTGSSPPRASRDAPSGLGVDLTKGHQG